MIGNDYSVKGGISSVIKQIMETDWEKEKISIKLIPTYIEDTFVKRVLFYFKSYIRIRKEIKYNKPNVVHIHMSYKGSFFRKYFISKICFRNNIPIITHLHGSEFKKWYDSCGVIMKLKINKFLKVSDLVIVLGEKWDKCIKEIEPRTQTIILPNAINIPKDIVQLKNKFKILFMGVLIKRKGVDDLLRAIQIIKASNEGIDIEVIIAGEGSEEKKLKTLCDNMELSDIVKFVGWTTGTKKQELLKSCNLFILPSYNEGLPVAILEALSYGMPVISTDVGDISSVVIDRKTGFLIKPGDVNTLSKLVVNIYKDKDMYLYMSNECRKLVGDKFSDIVYFEKIKACYEKFNK